ncbi:hypothetical protein FACS18948_0580 [Clostridia bacterium]|nr:hypothetical protein FACS18948_0580 [Clostridia bacterium]
MLNYGDSFGNATFPFMSMCFTTVDELDMRHYKGDFVKYYNEYDPDVVIGILQSDSENKNYNWFKK